MNFLFSFNILFLYTNMIFTYSIYSLNITYNNYNFTPIHYTSKKKKNMFFETNKIKNLYYDIKSVLNINIAKGEKKIKNILPNLFFVSSKKLYYDNFYSHYFIFLKESKISFVIDSHYYFYSKFYSLSYLTTSIGLSLGCLEANISQKHFYQYKRNFFINYLKLRSQYFNSISNQYSIFYENSLFKNLNYVINYRLVNIVGKYSSYDKFKTLKLYDKKKNYNFRFIHSLLIETQFFF